MFELAQYSDFLMDGSLQVRILFDCLKVDLLYCYLLLGVVFEPLENLAKGTFSQTLLSVVAILPDGLDGTLLHDTPCFLYYLNCQMPEAIVIYASSNLIPHISP